MVFDFGEEKSHTKSVPMKQSLIRLLRQSLRSLNFIESLTSLKKSDHNEDAPRVNVVTLFFLKRSVHVLSKECLSILCTMRALILFNAYELA